MKKTKNKAKKITQLSNEKLCNVQSNEYFIDDCERVRAFSLQLYASPENWGTLLEEAEHYAYILHDKDVNEDGTLKKPHYHLLLRFPNAKTKSAVRKLTNIDSLEADTTINFQRLINSSSAYQYLMHNTPEAKRDGKVPYDETLITCDDRTYWNDVTNYSTNDNETFVEDLLNKKLNHRSMAIKYGRDYIRNYSRYVEFADILQTEALKERTSAYRDELFSALADNDASEELPYFLKLDKEVRSLLTNYIAGCIIEAYKQDKAYLHFDITPSESARAYLDSLNNEIIGKVFDLLK